MIAQQSPTIFSIVFTFVAILVTSGVVIKVLSLFFREDIDDD